MKKRILGGVLALFLMLTLFMSAPLSLSAAEPEPFGTTRTSVEFGITYTISTQEELARFSLLSDSPYDFNYNGVTIFLTSDITITNDYDTTSVGNWTPIKQFYGTFDGEGHSVTIQCSANSLILGFFGENRGIVKNLTVAGSVSQHYRYSIGGIAGTNYGTILNCRNTADIHDDADGIIGGIAGVNNGHIINCYNSGTISNPFICGGIAGYCGSGSELVNCYNTGTVTSGYCPGSISGILYYASITNCYYLLSSCSNVIGRNDYSIGTNIVGFYTSGTLMVEFYGTTDLAKALNQWVFANQTASNDYFGWKAGSPYPILTMEPVIMTETLDNAVRAYPYSVSLGAISISTAAWTLTGGTLPPGLALSSDGAITGIPTASGIFNFTVSVQNGLGTASKTLSIKVLSLQAPISFTGIPASVTYGDAPFTVSISGGSGTGEITLGISGQTDLLGNPTTGVATINSSGVVTILKPGKFQITADKSGDDTYTACSAISSVVTANKAANAINITDVPASVTYGDAPFTVATSGGKGTGTLTLGISNQTDLSGNPTTGVATINASGVVTILKSGKFQITADKAADDYYAACSALSGVVTVNKKALTVSGIGAADKDYDNSYRAVITGVNTAVLTGILSGDVVSLDATNAVAFFSDSNTGNAKPVTFAGFALQGADAANYILTQPASVKANIRLASPDYTLPGILTATEGQKLADITLPKDKNGVFTFDAPLTTPVGAAGERNFTITFSPYDTINYKTVTGIVLVINVKAAATSSAASTPATSKASAASTPAASSTASDITAPQMGSPAADLLPLLLVLLFSAAVLVWFRFRKSRLTR